VPGVLNGARLSAFEPPYRLSSTIFWKRLRAAASGPRSPEVLFGEEVFFDTLFARFDRF